MRTNINITIDKLNIICFQQMRVVGQFRTVSYLVTVDNFMSMAERLNDLVSNFLQVMCAIGDKNGELQQEYSNNPLLFRNYFGACITEINSENRYNIFAIFNTLHPCIFYYLLDTFFSEISILSQWDCS